MYLCLSKKNWRVLTVYIYIVPNSEQMSGGFGGVPSSQYYSTSDVDRIVNAVINSQPNAYENCEIMIDDIRQFLESNKRNNPNFHIYLENLKLPIQEFIQTRFVQGYSCWELCPQIINFGQTKHNNLRWQGISGFEYRK